MVIKKRAIKVRNLKHADEVDNNSVKAAISALKHCVPSDTNRTFAATPNNSKLIVGITTI
jgi:hypothetical protein